MYECSVLLGARVSQHRQSKILSIYNSNTSPYGLPSTRDTWERPAGGSPEEGHKSIQKAETLLYEENLGELGFLNLEASRDTTLQPSSTQRGPVRKVGTNFLADLQLIGQRAMVLKWKRPGLDWTQGRNFYSEDSATEKPVFWRCCACLMPGSVKSVKNVKSKVGWGFGVTWSSEDVCIHGRGLG